MKELQSLSLAVEAILDDGEVVKFGKDEERNTMPKVGTGLMDLGSDALSSFGNLGDLGGLGSGIGGLG